MAHYGDITRKQMAFLIELVRRSRQALGLDHSPKAKDKQREARKPTTPDEPVEWLLTLNQEQGKLVRSGALWAELPANRSFYHSLAKRGYLGLLASEEISSGEMVIWPTERAEALEQWVAASEEHDQDGSA